MTTNTDLCTHCDEAPATRPCKCSLYDVWHGICRDCERDTDTDRAELVDAGRGHLVR